MADEFAIDDNNAEKARLDIRSKAHRNLPSREDRARNTEDRVVVELGSHNQDGLDFRHDAKVWHLYMVEAEREAKERAELWRTGLDAVLIFAGLFAGIVSAFVIDVRKDLEADSEQRLLANIDSILRSQQTPTTRIRAISIAMSGLWNISLYITLFAAMMGASAKAWLATFVPVNTPHEAKGAFHRYRLDQHAERWCLREVISAAPLLVQLALFLFLIGLVLQNFADNWVLGSILLLFCVSGGILYFLMTIHPWTTPSSPYNTAASDPLLWIALGLPSRGKKNPPDVEEDINKGLAGILYGHLLKSPKPNLVDEAIAEIALAGFKQKWIDYLCRKDTARVVLTRLRQCVTTRPTASDRDDNRVYNILLALLRFLEHYEVETQSPRYSKRDSAAEIYKDLVDVLDQLSVLEEHNHSITSLRDTTEEVRLLFLSLRIHLDCRSSAPKPSTSGALPRFPEWRGLSLGLDVSDSMMDLSHLKLAACRAVIRQHRQYVLPGAHLLCASLVSVATGTQQANASSARFTFAVDKNMEEACLSTASKCLSKLYECVSSEWEQHTRLSCMDIRLGPRRGGKGKIPTTTANKHSEKFSEELLENVSSILEEEEHVGIRAWLEELVKGQMCPEDTSQRSLLSVVQPLCSTIQDSWPEDRGPVIHLLAFLYSKYRTLFETMEVLTTLQIALPAMLNHLTSESKEAVAEAQPLVLRLLSAMSIIPQSRKQIILHVLSASRDPAQQHGLESNIELLIQLLSDERFADEPTDIVMIMFASQMLVDLPQVAAHQAGILDALRHRYDSKSLELDAVKHRELLDWFTIAVFGQHPSTQEVSNCVARCQLWFSTLSLGDVNA